MGMILEQLETPRPQLVGLRRNFKRSFRKNRRSLIHTLKNQYYLTSALADARRSALLNEDIALAVLIIIAGLGFATVSVSANALFVFVQAANVMSSVLHLNLAILVGLALVVVSILIGWATSLQQNLLTIALSQGANRKVKRSLRMTFKAALRQTTTSFTAWFVLLCMAAVPGAALLLTTGLVILLTHTALTEAAIYLIAAGLIGICWLAYVFMNYGLAPYVAVLEKQPDWLSTFQRAHQLVASRGRWFILSVHLGLLVSLLAIYALAGVLQKVFGMNAVATTLTLGIFPLTAANACLTMLYRKRKLARH
jgi:hypothetical protein